MIPIIEDIIDWNSDRYEQEYNHDLTCNLLSEEIFEHQIAITDVDRLDALVDTIYVSIGAMWKMGLTSDQIRRSIEVVCMSNNSKQIQKTPSNVKANLNKGSGFIAPEPYLQEILNERAKKA